MVKSLPAMQDTQVKSLGQEDLLEKGRQSTLAFLLKNFHGQRSLASNISSVQFNSVTHSCLTPCDPMDCSMPDSTVHHELPEITQTHVHRISDAIQPSHPLSSLLLLCSIFPNIRVFTSGGQRIGVSASASILLLGR